VRGQRAFDAIDRELGVVDEERERQGSAARARERERERGREREERGREGVNGRRKRARETETTNPPREGKSFLSSSKAFFTFLSLSFSSFYVEKLTPRGGQENSERIVLTRSTPPNISPKRQKDTEVLNYKNTTSSLSVSSL
jgi:hypothetical protein